MAQETLSIAVSSSPDGAQLFSLGGSLDLATSPSLRATLMEAADREKHEIIVDLSDLEFLDSTGLGALIGAHKRAAEHGGSVRLVAQEGQILRLLRITGLLDVFAVYPTLEAALSDDARLIGL
ncbi:MAG: STAS domain-containing protein [Candidatus Eremiobacteraeota bacterium]|nr:STAS domain-containing protein [Candidatus Eremiobacteraeota bacterium]